MAIIKNGKIHGRIGNYVYRVVNGMEIIQSYPRRTKQAGKATLGNKRFGLSSKMSSKIYSIAKEFALHSIDGTFYGELMAFIKSNFYSDQSIVEEEDYRTWKGVPFDRFWSINKGPTIQQILKYPPQTHMIEGIIRVQFPRIEWRNSSNKYIQRANYFSYSVILIHYDFETGQARNVFEFNSERRLKNKEYEQEDYEIRLEDLNYPIENGLLMICYGLRFFEMKDSYGYINSKKFNPCGVLGVWYKR